MYFFPVFSHISKAGLDIVCPVLVTSMLEPVVFSPLAFNGTLLPVSQWTSIKSLSGVCHVTFMHTLTRHLAKLLQGLLELRNSTGFLDICSMCGGNHTQQRPRKSIVISAEGKQTKRKKNLRTQFNNWMISQN